jgi:hypothetical protein
MPIQDLIRTIVQLQTLRQQEEATQLARERFGLEQQQTHAGILGQILGQLPGYQNPQGFIDQNVGELSQLSGASPGLLRSAAAQTPPSIGTTRAGAVARGAQAAGTSLDQPAASAALTGALPGGLSEDMLTSDFFTGAKSYFNQLPDSKKQTFLAQVASRAGKGMSLGAAAADEAFANLSPDEQTHAARIGKDLAPGASTILQNRLGIAQLKAQERFQETSLALDEIRVKGALEGHEKELGAQAMKEADDLISQRGQFLTKLSTNVGSLTPEGMEQYRTQINSYNEQLRRLAPQVFGKGGAGELTDIPAGKNAAASWLQTFMNAPKFPQ